MGVAGCRGMGFYAIALMRVLLLVVLLVRTVEAREGHIKLLAVAESGKGRTGAIANLSLEVKPGKGRVFLETFPVTKEDTQISMRFAKQVACSFVELECQDKDFVFTIRAGPGIVGGPSAGAAAAVLTVAVLADLPLREDVAMTGTINSGGIVGAVGGLKSKITAASRNRITKALIPLGTRMARQRVFITVERQNVSGEPNKNVSIDEEDLPLDDESPFPSSEPQPLVIANISVPRNGTFNVSREAVREVDLVAYGKEVGVNVEEVSTLEDAVVLFTGANMSRGEDGLVVSQEYVDVMRSISRHLCNRTKDLMGQARMAGAAMPVNHSQVEQRLNESAAFLNLSGVAQEKGSFYSAASYCFRANIQADAVIQESKNFSKGQAVKELQVLQKRVKEQVARMQARPIATITDLQATMIVLERLEEAQEVLAGLEKAENLSGFGVGLSFALERLESVDAWSKFFGVEGAPYAVEEENLRQGCADKMQEAQERLGYVNYYLPNVLGSVKQLIVRAAGFAEQGEFLRCLHVASLAKAEASLVGGLIGSDARSLPLLLDQKRVVAKRSIARAQKKGYFPIIGYSYLEYADNLKDADVNSALLFSEYALELSNMDMYFEDGSAREEKDGADGASEGAGKNQLVNPTGASVASLKGDPSVPGCSKFMARSFLAGFVVALVMVVAIVGLSGSPKGR